MAKNYFFPMSCACGLRDLCFIDQREREREREGVYART